MLIDVPLEANIYIYVLYKKKMVNFVLVRYLYRAIDRINYIHNTPSKN
jgi:hypothetical protein